MIAKELREIVANDINDVEVQNRLTALADEADRLAGELDATAASRDRDQEARAIGLREAARLLVPALSEASLTTVEVQNRAIAELWVQLAAHGAAWVRDGSRPEAPDLSDGGGGRR